MSFAEVLRSRQERCAWHLGLSDCAVAVLAQFVEADLDPNANAARDRYGRQAVRSWDEVLDGLVGPEVTVEAVESALDALVGWNVLQHVGRDPGDPIVAGPAALRLTGHGRVVAGLAPLGPPDARPETPDGPWVVLHGDECERVLHGASLIAGPSAWKPINGAVERDRLRWLCGEVAVALCGSGVAVVDGFGVQEEWGFSLLREMLYRTRSGRGVRVLAIRDPGKVRFIGLRMPLRLQWIGPAAAGDRDVRGVREDDAVTRHLMETEPTASMADVCGAPGTGLAVPRESNVRWEDMVVPARASLQLDQVLLHARYRLSVLPTRHGFAGKGTGYRLLLSGLPGTGKSMCAKALAHELGRPYVQLDLTAVLSKWLGETEQQLASIFEMSEASGSVLILDEADALFRQRQSGAGGQGALATAVAYLLTRLERYSGVLVATTNRTQDLDDAFFRRFDDYVVLSLPEGDTRGRLWRGMFQGVGRDASALDVDLLAARFPLTGGLIRGACIRASAWVVDHELTMPVMLAAIARELEKNDQSNQDVYLPPWGREVAELLMDEDFLARTA